MPDTMLHHAAVLNGPDLEAMDAYWRAANHLSVGQIYLYQPLKVLTCASLLVS